MMNVDELDNKYIRPISDYPGYWITINGKVYSQYGSGHRSIQNIYSELKQSSDKDGYQTVTLCKNRKRKTFKVHHLVLNEFSSEKRLPGQECRHLNDIKLNNHINNLKWGYGNQNIEDKIRNGRARGGSLKGCENKKAKLNNKQVLEIRELGRKNISHRKIASKYGVEKTTISRIIANKTWKHI